MKREFSPEQIELLQCLPAVRMVSPTRIYYTDAFRDEFLRRDRAGESPTEIFRSVGLDSRVVGSKRIERCVARWRRYASTIGVAERAAAAAVAAATGGASAGAAGVGVADASAGAAGASDNARAYAGRSDDDDAAGAGVGLGADGGAGAGVGRSAGRGAAASTEISDELLDSGGVQFRPVLGPDGVWTGDIEPDVLPGAGSSAMQGAMQGTGASERGVRGAGSGAVTPDSDIEDADDDDDALPAAVASTMATAFQTSQQDASDQNLDIDEAGPRGPEVIVRSPGMRASGSDISFKTASSNAVLPRGASARSAFPKSDRRFGHSQFIDALADRSLHGVHDGTRDGIRRGRGIGRDGIRDGGRGAGTAPGQASSSLRPDPVEAMLLRYYERISRLEAEVSELQRAVRQLQGKSRRKSGDKSARGEAAREAAETAAGAAEPEATGTPATPEVAEATEASEAAESAHEAQTQMPEAQAREAQASEAQTHEAQARETEPRAMPDARDGD